jgi:peroxiredoxin
MANALTGEFDVVAEFAIPSVNRVLAAMHRNERFPHSLTLRVDDNPPPGKKIDWPATVGIVDASGDAIVNHQRVGRPDIRAGTLLATNPLYAPLDPVVNTDLIEATLGTIVPSHLQGRAQLQLAPPTIEVTGRSGTNVTVRIRMMSRYFPDPNTSPLAEFVLGELQLTAAVNQVTSQSANVVDIDVRANSVGINFTPTWSSHPLSPEDLAAINLLIRNALKTGFLPSNNTLPLNIKYAQFKTLQGAQDAVGVLLNMDGNRGNADSFNNVFLGGGDDFAFGAGRDFVLAPFQSFPSVTDHRSSYFALSLNSPVADLQDGQILLTINGHAQSKKSYLPSFNFTVTQALTLALVATTPGGALNTAELALLGDVSLDIHGVPWGFGWVVDLFKGQALGPIREQRQTLLDQIQPRVRDMLSTDKNLGAFLRTLLSSPRRKLTPWQQPDGFRLAYTSVAIRPSGIILHGLLAVTDWPIADVEFERIPVNNGVGGGPGAGILTNWGPDYSALKTWIPGGAIQRYEWSSLGQTQPFLVDDHKFVLEQPPLGLSDAASATTAMSRLISPDIPEPVATTGGVSGYIPLCLTVKGLRLSAAGPVVSQPVTAKSCGFTSFPIISGGVVASKGIHPSVALTHPGPRGMVEVVGHASAQVHQAGSAGSVAPNLIVHFANEKTAAQLEFFTRALSECGRRDAATAILAVLTPDQLAKAPYVDGIIYTDDPDGDWERVFELKSTQRPATLIVDPQGIVLWRHDGELDSEALAAALCRYLTSVRSIRRVMLQSRLTVGQPPPNFLFEYAPGHELTLRKLAGRSAILVFWKSSSKTSIEAACELQKTSGKSGAQGPVVLAINDGEPAEVAQRVAGENGFSTALVVDPRREIALAYGANIWPTIVLIDAAGSVTGIRYGRAKVEPMESPTAPKSVASR